jgi:hypothetical protein
LSTEAKGRYVAAIQYDNPGKDLTTSLSKAGSLEKYGAVMRLDRAECDRPGEVEAV